MAVIVARMVVLVLASGCWGYSACLLGVGVEARLGPKRTHQELVDAPAFCGPLVASSRGSEVELAWSARLDPLFDQGLVGTRERQPDRHLVSDPTYLRETVDQLQPKV